MPQVKSLENNNNDNSRTICVPKISPNYNLPDTCWVEQQGS